MILSPLKHWTTANHFVVIQNEVISCIKTIWSTYSDPTCMPCLIAFVFVFHSDLDSTKGEISAHFLYNIISIFLVKHEIIIIDWSFACAWRNIRLHKNHTSFNAATDSRNLRISNRSMRMVQVENDNNEMKKKGRPNENIWNHKNSSTYALQWHTLESIYLPNVELCDGFMSFCSSFVVKCFYFIFIWFKRLLSIEF